MSRDAGQHGCAQQRQDEQPARQGAPKKDGVIGLSGDEMFILLQGIGCKEALTIAERIRQSIAGTPIQSSNQMVYISVSIGVAEINSAMDTIETLMKMADRALLNAKRNGRDQCVLWQPEPSERVT